MAIGAGIGTATLAEAGHPSQHINEGPATRQFHEEQPQPFKILSKPRKILLAALILVTISLIGLVEYACHVLPPLTSQKFVSDLSRRHVGDNPKLNNHPLALRPLTTSPRPKSTSGSRTWVLPTTTGWLRFTTAPSESTTKPPRTTKPIALTIGWLHYTTATSKSTTKPSCWTTPLSATTGWLHYTTAASKSTTKPRFTETVTSAGWLHYTTATSKSTTKPQTPIPNTRKTGWLHYTTASHDTSARSLQYTLTTPDPSSTPLPSGAQNEKGDEKPISYSSSIPTPSNPPSSLKAHKPIQSFTWKDYLLGAWVPTLIALLFVSPWYSLDTVFRTLEPYRQLARPHGASAENSLCLDYMTTWIFSTPIRAFVKGHWPVVLSSSIYCAAAFIVPLAPESVYIHTSGTCRENKWCYPSVVVYHPVARVIQSLLGVILLLAMILFFTLYHQSLPTRFDPRSIAGNAILAQDETLLSEFRHLNPKIHPKDVSKAVSGHKYKLGFWTSSTGEHRASIYQSRISDYSNWESPDGDSVNVDSGFGSHVLDFPARVSGTPSRYRGRWMYRSSVTAMLLGLVGLCSMIIYYEKTSFDDSFEHFMDSQSFGVRFLFTLFGLAIKVFWTKLYQEYDLAMPYIQLANGHASAQATLFLKPRAAPLTALFTYIRHRQALAALLAFVTLLAEALTVFLANIPYSRATTMYAFIICSYFCVAILSIMIITAATLLFHTRSELLPQSPGTIAATLLYVCESKMLGMFSDLQNVDEKTRNATVKSFKQSYGLGFLRTESGARRIGIDLDYLIEYPGPKTERSSIETAHRNDKV